jgi:hypothetical protein
VLPTQRGQDWPILPPSAQFNGGPACLPAERARDWDTRVGAWVVGSMTVQLHHRGSGSLTSAGDAGGEGWEYWQLPSEGLAIFTNRKAN